MTGEGVGPPAADAPAQMKRCPYCAEEIRAEAIKCRYCGSDLRHTMVERPAPHEAAIATVAAPAEPPAAEQPSTGRQVGEGAIQFSHSGFRYLLGFGLDFFGIWDREAPGGPVQRFPRSDDGWAAAWHAFIGMEPNSVAVGLNPGGGGSRR